MLMFKPGMLMQTRFFSLVQLGISFIGFLFMLVVSCKGPEGPIGPAGPTGATGPQGASGVAGATGPQGVSGATGNANVVYTAWKAVDLSGNYYREPDNLGVYIGNDNSTASPLLTQDVINKSIVYIYFKYGTPLFDNTTNEYRLSERIVQGSAYGSIKIPGRTTNTLGDFVNYNVFNQPIGVNFLNFLLYIPTFTTDTNGTRTPIPDFVGKNAQFFRDMFRDMPQYRIVIVNGSTPGGRMATLDYSDYAAVKQAHNLPD